MEIAMERTMSGVKRQDRLSNKQVKGKTQIQDCRYKMKKLKFEYAGHVARGGGRDRWERKVLDWVPRGSKRKVGRPTKRWVDEIRQQADIAWGRDAQVKRCWKRVREAYALQWAH